MKKEQPSAVDSTTVQPKGTPKPPNHDWFKVLRAIYMVVMIFYYVGLSFQPTLMECGNHSIIPQDVTSMTNSSEQSGELVSFTQYED